MGEVKIFTDSTSDLTPEIIKSYDIMVVPLYVGFDDETFRDGVDITPKELYKKVDKTGKLPKTSAPSPMDFYSAFKPFIDQGRDIVYIGLSSGLSSTIQNAQIATREFPEGRIEIVDSLNLSTGIGLLVLKAVDLAREGMAISEIAHEIRTRVPKVKTAFVIDTLDYLYMGGRCSALQNFISGILKIKPIVKVVEGKMILGEKSRGNRMKAINIMLQHAIEDKECIEMDRVMVTLSEGNNDGPYLKDEIDKSVGSNETLITTAGCVISSHCGPNTIGILYIAK